MSTFDPVLEMRKAAGSLAPAPPLGNGLKASVRRTVAGGLLGGVIFAATTFVTFVLIGSGLDHGSGPLFDPALQSPKVVAVWTEIEPLPLFVTQPQWMLMSYLMFGIGHAFLYRSVARAWPEGVAARAWRLAAITWSLSYLFFEFFGPFNLLGEPVGLVALELVFWALAAAIESAVVVWMLERRGKTNSLLTPAVENL